MRMGVNEGVVGAKKSGEIGSPATYVLPSAKT
jgi:hypothetical protein